MAKKAKYLGGDDFESEEVESSVEDHPAEPVESKRQKASRQLEDLGKFMAKKSEDVLSRDYGLNRVHINMLSEAVANKDKGKPVNYSDGMCEMIDIQHGRLKKKGKL